MTGTITSKNKGFTLIEVMISLMVLVVLTLIFAACVPVAKKAGKMNGQYSQALSLCQHKIDQMRAFGYGKINFEELAPIIIDEDHPAQPWSFTDVDGVADILIDPQTQIVIPYSDDDRIKVRVTITWKTTAYESKRSSASVSAIITNVE